VIVECGNIIHLGGFFPPPKSEKPSYNENSAYFIDVIYLIQQPSIFY